MSDDEKMMYVESRDSIITPMTVQDAGRIIAGQAISDLSSAVKELVDNALDAGSTSITIRLFNQGIDVIEVSDNGIGVPMKSRSLMATKHATSKIRSFQDLYEDKKGRKGLTLGFRGEALFCLANLSQNLVVSTRTNEDTVGQKMHFRKDGSLDPTCLADIQRTVGTTVAVVKIFDSLPVRRADFIKRIKAQRAKLLRVLQSYAILCVGVRFHVIDVSGVAGSSQFKSDSRLCTNEKSQSLKDTISAVLGSRFLAGLCSIHIDLNSMVDAVTDRMKAQGNKIPCYSRDQSWRIDGLVSKAPGSTFEGEKIAREVQIFSLNGRPVDLPKISRVLLDSWKLYDPMGNSVDDTLRKRPACILQIYLPNYLVDVNISPDKREIYIVDDDNMIIAMKEALSGLWSSQRDGVFKTNEASALNKKRHADDLVYSKHQKSSEDVLHTSSAERVRLQQTKLQFRQPLSGNSESLEELSRGEKTSKESPVLEHSQNAVERPQTGSTYVLEDDDPLSSSSNSGEHLQLLPSQVEFGQLHAARTDELTSNVLKFIEKRSIADAGLQSYRAMSASRSTLATDSEAGLLARDNPVGSSNTDERMQIEPSTIQMQWLQPINPDDTSDVAKITQEIKSSEEPLAISSSRTVCNAESDTVMTLKFESSWQFGGTSSVIDEYRKSRRKMKATRRHLSSRRINGSVSEDFEFVDGDLEDETVFLSKAELGQLNIIGQFNLGFILATCPQFHLWILDQHACDERKNFEVLCNTTAIHEQYLIQPLSLELSPSEEACVIENMTIFKRHGFRFIYDDTKPVRQRLSLTALPHSGSGAFTKAVQFDKDDVSALCSLLGADAVSSSSSFVPGSGTGADGGGSMGNNAVRRYTTGTEDVIRLPKTVAMFASRACRSSKMIGDALSYKDMQGIIENLKNVAEPWTCPHGRPTMRHVKALLPLLIEDECSSERRINLPTCTLMTQMGEG